MTLEQMLHQTSGILFGLLYKESYFKECLGVAVLRTEVFPHLHPLTFGAQSHRQYHKKSFKFSFCTFFQVMSWFFSYHMGTSTPQKWHWRRSVKILLGHSACRSWWSKLHPQSSANKRSQLIVTRGFGHYPPVILALMALCSFTVFMHSENQPIRTKWLP